MRLAILGSVTAPVPPSGQAAIERLVYHLVLGLAERGHQILLFAPAGSAAPHPNVTLVEVAQKVMLSGTGHEGKAYEEDFFGASYKLRLELVNLANVWRELLARRNEYEVILNHLRGEAVLLPLGEILAKPFYHVLHLPIFPELADLLQKYQTHLIALSQAQQLSFPQLNWAGVAYNGVDTAEFAFAPAAGDYLLYLGSIGRNKNPQDAILAVKQAGEKLLIGGRVKDREYYEQEVKPLIDGEQIRWLGEVTISEVVKLYQGAKAFLFPPLWPEPFGLVMIEAMSCGTPVIAYNSGSVSEVVRDGLTGFVVEPEGEAGSVDGALAGSSFAAHPSSDEDLRVTRRKGPVDAQPSSLGVSSMEKLRGMRASTGGRGGAGPAIIEKRVTVLETTRPPAPPSSGGWIIQKRGIAGLVEAIKRISEIERKACRVHVEQNFTVAKMVEAYEKILLS